MVTQRTFNTYLLIYLLIFPFFLFAYFRFTYLFTYFLFTYLVTIYSFVYLFIYI